MQVSSVLIGGTAIGFAAKFLTALIISVPPIDIHSIEFVDGKIVQSRTVTADGPTFFAQWHAAIIDDATGEPVEWCDGSGSWEYKVGYLAINMTLAKWTGSDACTIESLPAGEYRPRAVWVWGDDQVSREGPIFEVKK